MSHDIRIAYGPHAVTLQAGETTLDALLRVGSPLPFSCKSGVCRSCMVRCLAGDVPERAQRGLPPHLAEHQYLLACQCRPQASLVLGPPRAEDMLTTCVLASVAGHGTGTLRLELEPATALAYRRGDRARLVLPGVPPAEEPVLTLVGDPAQDYFVTAELLLAPGQPEPAALAADAFGTELVLRGPLPPAGRPAGAVAPPAGPELAPPPPDAALWAELDDGRTVRQVLEAFYAKVYADAQLAPFFEGVTINRSIEKQYSFLKQAFTGEKCYFGNRPRNAHHWMIVTEALFDHRQAIMVQTLREAGLDEDQIARWTGIEEHYRSEIVKAAVWPRQVGDELVDTEQFETCTLTDATVCDHCGAPVEAGTTVRFHRRLGRIGCADCQAGRTPATAAQAGACA